MIRAFLVVIAACSLLACSDKRGASTAPGGGAFAGDALVTVAMWPAHWKELDKVIAAGRAKLPADAAAQLDKLVAEHKANLASPMKLVELVALHGLDIELPPALPVDESRPIVVAAFTPVEPMETMLALVARRITTPTAVVGAMVRHRIVLPTKDVDGLVAALSTALKQKARTAEELDKPLAEVAPLTFAEPNKLVRLEKAAGSVTATIVMGANLDRLDAAARARVFGSPVPVVEPKVAEPSIARVQVRVDRFAEVAPRLGMVNIERALADSRDAGVLELFAGYSETLTAELFLDPAALAVVGGILDVPAVPPHLPALVYIPSPMGLAALKSDPKLAAGARVGIAEVDPYKIAKGVKMAPIVERAGKLENVATLMHECGMFCMLSLMFGNAVSWLPLAERSDVEKGLRDMIAEAPQLGIVKVSLAGSVLLVEPFGEVSPKAATAARELSAAPAVKPTEAAGCWSRALLGVREALRDAPPERAELAGVFDRTLAQHKADLDCAAKDPALAVRVAGLRDAMTAAIPR